MSERPVSVTILGILNIGFGFIGLAGELLSKMSGGLDASSAGSSLSSSFPMLAPVMALWNAILKDAIYVVWGRIFTPLDAAADLALVAAGIGLLLLKNWSRLVSIGYSLYTTVSLFLNAAVWFVALDRVLGNASQTFARETIAIVIAATALATVLGLIYPVLLAYFLTRPKAILAFQPEAPSPL